MAGALYGFAYSRDALAYLKTTPAKHRKQIVNKINGLAAQPHPANCKVVQGMTDGEDQVYRIRSGDYRVLYVVRENPAQIIILDIDHRKDVYR
jgi:mRNA interferase RelE/StbE